MHSSLSSTIDWLAIVTLSFSAGLAVGLLLAPDEGRQIRQRLAVGVRDVAQVAQSQARAVADPFAERVRKTSHKLAERHIPLADNWDVVDGKEFLRDLPRLSHS